MTWPSAFLLSVLTVVLSPALIIGAVLDVIAALLLSLCIVDGFFWLLGTVSRALRRAKDRGRTT